MIKLSPSIAFAAVAKVATSLTYILIILSFRNTQTQHTFQSWNLILSMNKIRPEPKESRLITSLILQLVRTMACFPLLKEKKGK